MFVAKLFLESIYDGDQRAFGILSPKQQESISRHNLIAHEVCRILSLPQDEFKKLRKVERETFYANLGQILRYYPRAALFVPFYVLREPTDQFKNEYLKAWQKCCAIADVREEFHIGDYFEPEASIGEPDNVIKAMHLTPWLLMYGYLKKDDVVPLAKKYQQDESVAIWGLLDGAIAASKMGIINSGTLSEVQKIADAAKSARPEPPRLIRITPKRKKWLQDRAQNYGISPQTFRLRNPAGPFSKNIEPKDIKMNPSLPSHEHLILQGSRLKGYSRPGSDYDYFIYDDRGHKMYSYDKEKGKCELDYLTKRLEFESHLILLGAWLGEDKVSTESAQLNAASHYYKMSRKLQEKALFSIERTTIQCRLMQKGMFCAYADISENTKHLKSIDGDSAFYDDRFRVIATQICAKYLYLPQK